LIKIIFILLSFYLNLVIFVNTDKNFLVILITHVVEYIFIFKYAYENFQSQVLINTYIFKSKSKHLNIALREYCLRNKIFL